LALTIAPYGILSIPVHSVTVMGTVMMHNNIRTRVENTTNSYAVDRNQTLIFFFFEDSFTAVIQVSMALKKLEFSTI
jgi:hypothetical protein